MAHDLLDGGLKTLTVQASRGSVRDVRHRLDANRFLHVPGAKEWPMLVLSRKKDESIVINNDITIVVVEIRGDKVRLGVEAPKEVPVHRREVFEAIARRGDKTEQQAIGSWAVARTGSMLAWTAFADMLVFFAVLLVGFAYVWYRGDLDWVRAVSAERAA